jgi:hypothetical protein
MAPESRITESEMMTDAKTTASGKDTAFLKRIASTSQIGLMKLVNQFAFWSGAVLLALGAAVTIGALGKSQVVEMRDPVFGVPFRGLMLGIGIIQILIAGLLLFTSKIKVASWLVIWIAINFLAYRIGLWCMGWRHSSGFTFEPLGVSMQHTDVIMSAISTGLLAGFCIQLWLKHRRAEESKFSKTFCPACGGHIKFAIENLGQKTSCPHCKASVTLRNDENLKMSCFFCQEHIEFPAHAIGTKMACPHCKMDITLKEP